MPSSTTERYRRTGGVSDSLDALNLWVEDGGSKVKSGSMGNTLPG